MKDVDQAILEAFTTALDGNVSYSSSNVPIYCEFNPNAEDIYIILSTVTGDDNRTKSSFGTNSTILIDIVHKSGTSVSYDVVNNVVGQVLDLIEPTTATSLTSPDPDLRFANVRRLSTNTLTLTSAGNNIMRKLLRYSLQVFE
jgi:hypothetical protein